MNVTNWAREGIEVKPDRNLFLSIQNLTSRRALWAVIPQQGAQGISPTCALNLLKLLRPGERLQTELKIDRSCTFSVNRAGELNGV